MNLLEYELTFAQRFRKEAIYRSMQHYSREYRRTQARVEELERWQRNCEAGIAALQACWTEVLTIVTLLCSQSLTPYSSAH